MSKSKILVINAGSSSIKLSLFNKEDLSLIAKGAAEKITLKGGSIIIKSNGQEFTNKVDLLNHEVAIKEILKLIEQHNIIEKPEEIEYIGFRIVNGGPFFKQTTKLTDQIIEQMNNLIIYAPLHNPGAIQAIKSFKKVMPFAKMCLEFDTSFHSSIPTINNLYPIPFELSQKYHIKKYGAHGISHEYITLKLQEILKKEKVNFINMHIGNGASICAIKDSKSFDTSMGLTPLAGIAMGTRSGDIDPSIHQFLIKQMNISIDELTDILNTKSGLLGLSNVSSDMRDIIEQCQANNVQAQLAFDIYISKIVDYAAMYANKLENKLDALVFTAGIGENQSQVWEQVINKLKFYDILLDKSSFNLAYDDYKMISDKKSKVKVFAIRTNEEWLIANKTLAVFENKK